MTNCTMIVRDRPEMTMQALRGFLSEIPASSFNLVVYDDESQPETKEALDPIRRGIPNVRVFENPASSGTGEARNASIRESERAFGRGQYLYLSDNDVVFTTNWLPKLIRHYEWCENLGFRILGGWNHPYHQPNRRYVCGTVTGELQVWEQNAVAGASWLMTWETWDTFGPLVKTPVGKVGQSEDHEFCQRVRQAGYKVGCVWPHLVHNVGAINTFGEPTPGAELMKVPDAGS